MRLIRGNSENELAESELAPTALTRKSVAPARFREHGERTEPDIRQGIREFSDWPTIPQLYVRDELVGGADIVREMYESGELAETFGKHGIDIAAV